MLRFLRRYRIPKGAKYFKIKMDPHPDMLEVRYWGFEKWRDIRIKEMEHNGATILKVRGKKISGYYFPKTTV